MGVTYVPIRDWGGTPPAIRRAMDPARQRGLAVHHTGEEKGWRPRSHVDCSPKVRAIERAHRAGRGWRAIGYSWVVCPHGYVFEGRGIGDQPAAQGGKHAYEPRTGNLTHHACAVLGNLSIDPLTAAAIDGVWYCRGLVVQNYPGATDVSGHSHFAPTACPGRRGDALVDQMRRDTKEGDRMATLDDEDRRFLTGLIYQSDLRQLMALRGAESSLPFDDEEARRALEFSNVAVLQKLLARLDELERKIDTRAAGAGAPASYTFSGTAIPKEDS